MCLIAVAVDPPGPWSFVLAANRDEFHDRHAAPAAWWAAPDDDIFGGRDLQAGGSWLALRRLPGSGGLRLAALTNLRPGLMPSPPPAGAGAAPPSRGGLVSAFLRADEPPGRWMSRLQPPPQAYAGFNLIAAAIHGRGGAARVDVGYLNNLPDGALRPLGRGSHALSNATLGVSWPKTDRLLAGLDAALAAAGGDADRLAERLLQALSDRTPAPDSELPSTGLDPARERLLSAPFIVDEHYGTRASTVVVVARGGGVLFVERSFGPRGRPLGTVAENL